MNIAGFEKIAPYLTHPLVLWSLATLVWRAQRTPSAPCLVSDSPGYGSCNLPEQRGQGCLDTGGYRHVGYCCSCYE